MYYLMGVPKFGEISSNIWPSSAPIWVELPVTLILVYLEEPWPQFGRS